MRRGRPNRNAFVVNSDHASVEMKSKMWHRYFHEVSFSETQFDDVRYQMFFGSPLALVEIEERANHEAIRVL